MLQKPKMYSCPISQDKGCKRDNFYFFTNTYIYRYIYYRIRLEVEVVHFWELEGHLPERISQKPCESDSSKEKDAILVGDSVIGVSGKHLFE